MSTVALEIENSTCCVPAAAMVARSAAHRLRVQVLAIRGSDKAVGGSVGPGRGARYVPTAELRLALAEIEAESDRRFNAGTDPYLVLARGGELAG